MQDTTSRPFGLGSYNTCYQNFAGSEKSDTGLLKSCGNHSTKIARRPAPVSKSPRKDNWWVA